MALLLAQMRTHRLHPDRVIHTQTITKHPAPAIAGTAMDVTNTKQLMPMFKPS
jgi:hypothetical protein